MLRGKKDAVTMLDLCLARQTRLTCRLAFISYSEHAWNGFARCIRVQVRRLAVGLAAA
jgi:hypothetical protein